MQRFFSNNPCSDTLQIAARDQLESYHQMTRVLRMQTGDHCVFFEEGGDDHVYEIIGIDKRAVELKRVSVKTGMVPATPSVTLCQSLPNKLEKLEFILQKGVEVGVDEFVFFHAERSQKLALLEKKKERLGQITVEAVEQSGGNRVPKLRFLKDLGETLEYASSRGDDTKILVTHTDGQGNKLRDIPSEYRSICLFVGPEGGFAPDEIAGFRTAGAMFLDLGPRILRTETAGIVTTFALQEG